MFERKYAPASYDGQDKRAYRGQPLQEEGQIGPFNAMQGTQVTQPGTYRFVARASRTVMWILIALASKGFMWMSLEDDTDSEWRLVTELDGELEGPYGAAGAATIDRDDP
ncbi:MAG: hypothetical protein ACXWP0_12105 [Ktedonobacterales bacterium]